MSQSSSLWKQQSDIMDKFNFERVQRTMQALDWKWCGLVPSIQDLQGTAEMLLSNVTRQIEEGTDLQWFSTSTGGFKASGKLVNGNWVLSLEFVVASQDGFIYWGDLWLH